MQIHDYLRVYEDKSDEELCRLAHDIDRLTPEAGTALQSELLRRGLNETNGSQVVEFEEPESPLIVRALKTRFGSTTDFLAAVTRIYREHFSLFLKLTAPAVVLGYCVVQILRPEVIRFVREALVSGQIDTRSAMLQISIIAQVTYLASWMMMCGSYAAASSAVQHISVGEVPSTAQCLDELSQRIWPLVKVSALLYVILGVAYLVCGLLIAGLWSVTPRIMRGTAGKIILYVLMFAAMLIVSRLALAIPAVMQGKAPVRRAIFLSDELTEGKWSALAALIVKSVWGGYVAGMLPFWVAAWTGIYSLLNWWVLASVSVAAVTVVEPFMLIGFSLMYVRSIETAPTVESLAWPLQST